MITHMRRRVGIPSRRALETAALGAVERVALRPLMGALVWALDREVARRLVRRRGR
jgi:hypothetical protein